MRTCYLHVGMPKTGTTSIQRALDQAQDLGPVRYLKTPGHENHGAPIFSMFSERRYDFQLHVKEGLDKQQIDSFTDEQFATVTSFFDAYSDSDVVVSAEIILSMTRSEVQKMLNFLGSFFDRIQMIAYVRTPRSYMTSFLQQQIKGGIASFNPDSAQPRYRLKFEGLLDALPNENASLIKYAPDRFPSQCVVRDFCRRVGIAESGTLNKPLTNRTMSTASLAIIYCYRQHYPFGTGNDARFINRDMVKFLRGINSPPFQLAVDAVDPVLESATPDIRWMEQRLGESLEEDVSEPLASDIACEEDLLDCAANLYPCLARMAKDQFGLALANPRRGKATSKVVADALRKIWIELASGRHVQIPEHVYR